MITALLVDDDDVYARLVQLALDSTVTVRTQPDVASALRALADERFDVIVCDLHLSDAAGPDAIAALVAAAPDTALLAISGVDGPDVPAALAAGASEFHLKGDELESGFAASVHRAARWTVALRTPSAPAADAWEALANAAPVGMFRCDAAGRLRWANARLYELLGRDGTGLVGGGWLDALYPSDRGEAVGRWRDALALERPFTLDLRFRRPDGRVVDARLEGGPLGDGWAVVVVDETARRAAERQLAASRAQLDAFIGASASPIFLKDLAGRLVLANPASEEVFGRPVQDIVGQKAAELVSPECGVQVDDLDRQVLAQDAARQDEILVPHVDGTSHTWLSVRFPVHDSDGIVTGVGVVSTDISARLALEQEVERQHRLLEQAQDVARIAVWSFDPATGILDSSAELAALCGFAGHEGPGLPEGLRAAVSAEDLERVRAVFEHSRTHPGDYDERVRCAPEGGEPRMLHLWWRSERRHGRISIVGTTQDVTQEHEREQALHAAQERLRLAFETAPVGFAIADAQGRWCQVNGAVCALLGRRAGQLLGTQVDAVIHPEDRDLDAGRLAMLTRGEVGVYEVEKRCLRADGTVLRVVFSVSAVRFGSERADHLLIQMLDVTARRDLEERVRAEAAGDPLTGLPDRRLFEVDLVRAAARCRRSGEPATLALVGLTDAQDEQAVGRMLRAAVRETDVVARLGPGRFAVLLPGAAPESAAALEEKLLAACRTAAPEADLAVGTARLGAGGDDAQATMRAAEDALAAGTVLRASDVRPRPA